MKFSVKKVKNQLVENGRTDILVTIIEKWKSYIQPPIMEKLHFYSDYLIYII